MPKTKKVRFPTPHLEAVQRLFAEGMSDLKVQRDAGPKMLGFKADDGKLPYHLIPDDAEAEIVAVLGFGAIKYEPGGWAFVEGAKDRYFAAARRHLRASRKGEILDPEHGLMTLASAACCVLFLLGLELQSHPELVESMPERFKLSLEKAKALRAKRTAPWAWQVVLPNKPFEEPIGAGYAMTRAEALLDARAEQSIKGVRKARIVLKTTRPGPGEAAMEVLTTFANVKPAPRDSTAKKRSPKKVTRRRKN